MIARLTLATMVVAAMTASASAEPCPLCAREIVTNSDLASCFLRDFERYAAKDAGAVVVDLTGCERSRGVVEALPSPTAQKPLNPDTQFMLSRAQLACLRDRLEEPGLVLDPSARIKLDICP